MTVQAISSSTSKRHGNPHTVQCHGTLKVGDGLSECLGNAGQTTSCPHFASGF